MGEVSGTTFHSTASGLHVDPEEVPHERLLEVTIDVGVVDNPEQLVN